MSRFLPTMFAALAAVLPAQLTAQTERDLATPTAAKSLIRVTAAEIDTWVNQGYRIVDLEITGTAPYQYTVSMVPNSGAFAVAGWWWWVGVSSVQLETALTQNNARLIDIESYNVGGQRLFAGVAVANTGANHKQSRNFYNANLQTIADHVQTTNSRVVDLDGAWVNGVRLYSAITIPNVGADARAWWWYLGVSAAQVATLPGQLGARTIDLERDSNGTYDIVLIQDDGAHWWQYVGLYVDEIDRLLGQNGARALDIEAYYVSGVPRYDVVMVNRSNALSTQIGDILRTLPVGRTGCYLAEIQPLQTSVRAAVNETSTFEPASTLKTLPLVHAMRRVQNGSATLAQNMTTYLGLNGTCPTGGAPSMNESMATALRLMMENSDNARTKTIVDSFGRASINTSASTLGMASTSINHVFGCGGPIANATTLEDLGRLHAQVVRGYVGDQRATLYDLMINDPTYPTVGTLSFESVMVAEANSLGLTSAEYQAFRSRIVYACKGGNYDNDTTSRYQGSYFGYLGLPRVQAGQVVVRDLVAGVYFNDAANKTLAFDTIGRAMVEMLRSEIRSALATWSGAPFGSFTYFGSMCAGSNGLTGLGVSGSPRVGQSVTYSVTNGPHSMAGLFCVGSSSTQWNGLALPYDLAPLGAPGCKLSVAPDVRLDVFTSAGGSAAVQLTLPLSPSLVGGTLFTQWVLVDPPANALGLITSRAIATTVGLGI